MKTLKEVYNYSHGSKCLCGEEARIRISLNHIQYNFKYSELENKRISIHVENMCLLTIDIDTGECFFNKKSKIKAMDIKNLRLSARECYHFLNECNFLFYKECLICHSDQKYKISFNSNKIDSINFIDEIIHLKEYKINHCYNTDYIVNKSFQYIMTIPINRFVYNTKTMVDYIEKFKIFL